MSVQLINLVILVAIINGVYSDTECQNSTPPTLPKKEFRIALVPKMVSMKNGVHEYCRGSLIYDPSSQEVEVKLDAESESPQNTPDTSDSTGDENIILLSGQEVTHFYGKLYAASSAGRVYFYNGRKIIWWMNVAMNPITWATVQGDSLYLGPNGNDSVNLVARLRRGAPVSYFDFTDQFAGLKTAAGMENGYMTHESCVYSEIHNEFYFLPNKASQNNDDSGKAANILLTMDKDMNSFKKVAEIKHSTEHNDRGYSSFAFIPDTGDEVIVALQTSDVDKFTYITAFNREGKVVLNSMKISDEPLNGLEFL